MVTLKSFAYSVDIYVALLENGYATFLLNVDNVGLKLYTSLSQKPKYTLFAGSTVVVFRQYVA